MSPFPGMPRGMYFEEFETGQIVQTPGRTITETDIVHFAGLSGDFNQIHVDAAFSEKSFFGKRVAHGLLILSIASGLAGQTGLMGGTVIAFREINEWKFLKPVFIGDTVHAELEVRETKELRRIGGGAVSLEVRVINQAEEIVMKGMWTALITSRPG